jgi:DNA processing protein
MSKEKIYYLALSQIPNIGPLTFHKLIAKFMGAENAWRAKGEELRAKGFGKNIIDSIIEGQKKINPQKILEDLEKKKISAIVLFEKEYPVNLKQIPDPPPVLYFKGDFAPSDKNSIAIVGSRRTTSYGRDYAQKFSSELAGFGLTIISGMARGIDGIAHQSALDMGGRTIAGLGSGVDIIYPYENRKSYEKICAGAGAVISEFPQGTKPHPGHFPQRNRIVAGLALGVLVVEAAEKSGSMITPRLAVEYNREVFAIPGPIYQPTSQGTAALIKEGAKLVTSVSDIIDELQFDNKLLKKLKAAKGLVPSAKSEGGIGLSNEEVVIAKILKDEPKHIDQIVRESGLKTENITSALAMMEIGKKIKQIELGMYKLEI